MTDSSLPLPHSYILLRDKSDGCRRGKLLGGSYERHTHHRTTYSLQPIRYDGPSDVAPLSEVECYLLVSIYSAADRYDVYSTPGKLEWGRSLKVGDTVLARLPKLSGRGSSHGGQQHQYTTAIIRWCGRVEYIFGERYVFGVEILVSSYVYIPVYYMK